MLRIKPLAVVALVATQLGCGRSSAATQAPPQSEASVPPVLDYIGNAKDVSLYVETIDADGIRLRSGTGFEVMYPGLSQSVTYFFLVTAKHLLTDAKSIRIRYPFSPKQFDELDRSRNTEVTYNLEPRKTWEAGADDADVAVIFTGDNIAQYGDRAPGTPKTIFLDHPKAQSGTIQDGVPSSRLPEMFFAGFPRGIYSTSNLQAILRRCTLAADSADELPLVAVGPKEFLIACDSQPGDSGAPVFSRTIEIDPATGRIAKYYVNVVGILAGRASWKSTFDVDEDEVAMHRRLGLSRVVFGGVAVAAMKRLLLRTGQLRTK